MSISAGHDYEAIVIGAGVAGIYQIKRLVDLGVEAALLDAAPDLGGTWYWNRYPGCRFDSESYSYGYSFSQELLEEWDWTEHFAPQPETERYLNYVADKLDLRRDIQFRSRVKAATWDQIAGCWETTLEDGARCRSRYLVTARAREVREEHELLDAALRAVLDGACPPLRMRLASTDPAQLWTSLGMPARAGFVLLVTADAD